MDGRRAVEQADDHILHLELAVPMSQGVLAHGEQTALSGEPLERQSDDRASGLAAFHLEAEGDRRHQGMAMSSILYQLRLDRDPATC